MGNDINMLIILTDGENIIRVALQMDYTEENNEISEFWGEPENKKKIFEKLPLHVRSFGKIVECERLFEITTLK